MILSERNKENGAYILSFENFRIVYRFLKRTRAGYAKTICIVLFSLKKVIDGEILCPFFKEGGRFTIDDVHYVKYGDELVPANETEFAKDKTFGYSAPNMPAYIEEKILHV